MVNLIVATMYCPHANQSIIGVNGRLPFHSPVDLQRFNTLTTAGVVIMGRKTHESIGRPLVNRTNVVLTHQARYGEDEPEILVYHDLLEAVAFAEESEKEVWIIGGGEVYKQAFDLALPDKIYLSEMKQTHVLNWHDALTAFPDFDSDVYPLGPHSEECEDHFFRILDKNKQDVL
jgi:dihydrofolate reductase